MTNKLTQDIIDEVLIHNPTKVFKDIHKAYYICKARLEGRTYKDIGKELNISPSRVRDYVVRTLAIYRQRKRKEQAKMKMKLTNYEIIKNMSIEEMAAFFIDAEICIEDFGGLLNCNDMPFCTICFRKWLESEVEE